MGHVKVDIDAKERNLTVKYALNDAAGVKSLLRDRYRIAARKDVITEISSAIESAGLTSDEAEAIGYLYGAWRLTPEQSAKVMSVKPTDIERYATQAAVKIAAWYEKKGKRELEVTV